MDNLTDRQKAAIRPLLTAMAKAEAMFGNIEDIEHKQISFYFDYSVILAILYAFEGVTVS